MPIFCGLAFGRLRNTLCKGSLAAEHPAISPAFLRHFVLEKKARDIITSDDEKITLEDSH
jgi:hypothetical protein